MCLRNPLGKLLWLGKRAFPRLPAKNHLNTPSNSDIPSKNVFYKEVFCTSPLFSWLGSSMSLRVPLISVLITGPVTDITPSQRIVHDAFIRRGVTGIAGT